MWYLPNQRRTHEERSCQIQDARYTRSREFAHLVTRYEMYECLVDLDERIVLRWLMPGKPGADELGPPGSTKYRVWVRPKNSINKKVLGGGHLVHF